MIVHFIQVIGAQNIVLPTPEDLEVVALGSGSGGSASGGSDGEQARRGGTRVAFQEDIVT